MFHQIRRSYLIVMLTFLMALLISVSWANIGVSPVGAQTTSSQSNNIGPSPTPTPDLTCAGTQQSISRPADSSNVIIKVGDFVWLDGNGNGIQDNDEQGVPDITCGVCEEGISGPALDTDITDAVGAYELDISVSSDGNYYLICASLSQEYTFTDKDAGDDDSVDSDFASVANEDYALFGQTDTFLVMPNQADDFTIDAGLVLSATPTPTNTPTATPSPTPSVPPVLTCDGGLQQSISRSADSSSFIVKVGDFVWLDGNGNGIQDNDEPGVPDITCGVCEEGISGPALDTDITDDAGAYELDISVSNNGDYYLICASLSDLYGFTDQDVGNDDEIDSDFASVDNEEFALFGQTDTFLVMPGQADDFTIDAGLVFLPTPTPTPTNTPTTTPTPEEDFDAEIEIPDINLLEGQQLSQILTISNIGQTTFNWEAYTEDTTGLHAGESCSGTLDDFPGTTLDPTSGTIPPGQASDVTMETDTSDVEPGNYTGNVCVRNTDTDNVIVIPLTMTIETATAVEMSELSTSTPVRWGVSFDFVVGGMMLLMAAGYLVHRRRKE